jgi:hypothetical protein
MQQPGLSLQILFVIAPGQRDQEPSSPEQGRKCNNKFRFGHE